MSASEPDDLIDEIAAEWVVRRDLRPDDRELEQRIADWTALAPSHREAMARAIRMWSALDQLGSRDAASPVPVEQHKRSALMAICASIAFMIWLGLGSAPKVPDLAPAYFASDAGRDRTVRLADGSIARLKAGSAIRVAFAPQERGVALERGEAWFDVAKNPSRPFVVTADRLNVRAVGTAFLVIRDRGSLKTVVSEGVVRVSSTSGGLKAWSLSQGNGVSMTTDGDLTSMSSAEAREHLAWTRGEIALRNQTLANAAETFNAYNPKKIVIDDPQLGRSRIVGWFELDEPERFAAAAAAAAGGEAVEKNGVIIIDRLDPGRRDSVVPPVAER